MSLLDDLLPGNRSIFDDGTLITPARDALEFKGSVSVADDANNKRTVVTVAGAGTGDVVGPSSAADNELPRFDGTSGDLLQGSGITVSDARVISNVGDPLAAQDVATKSYVDSLGATDWASVLSADPSSGANNPSIDPGQYITFGGQVDLRRDTTTILSTTDTTDYLQLHDPATGTVRARINGTDFELINGAALNSVAQNLVLSRDGDERIAATSNATLFRDPDAPATTLVRIANGALELINGGTLNAVGQDVVVSRAGTTIFESDGPGTASIPPGALQVGSSLGPISASGQLQTPNNWLWTSRASDGVTDVDVLRLTTADTIALGDSANAVAVNVDASNVIRHQIGGTVVTETRSGRVILQDNGIGAVISDGIIARNQTASTSGAPQQISPARTFEAHGWSGAADQKFETATYLLPSGTDAVADLRLAAQLDDGGWTDVAKTIVDFSAPNTSPRFALVADAGGGTAVFSAADVSSSSAAPITALRGATNSGAGANGNVALQSADGTNKLLYTPGSDRLQASVNLRMAAGLAVDYADEVDVQRQGETLFSSGGVGLARIPSGALEVGTTDLPGTGAIRLEPDGIIKSSNGSGVDLGIIGIQSSGNTLVIGGDLNALGNIEIQNSANGAALLRFGGNLASAFSADRQRLIGIPLWQETDGIGTTITEGVVSKNETAATSGTPLQYSPAQVFEGHIWDGAADRKLETAHYLRPDTSIEGVRLRWAAQVDGGGWNDVAELGNDSIDQPDRSAFFRLIARAGTTGETGTIGRAVIGVVPVSSSDTAPSLEIRACQNQGAGSHGDLELQSGAGIVRARYKESNDGFEFLSSALGFFGASGVAQPADPGALTDSSGGTVDGTVAAVSGSGDDAAINDNFAELTDRVNALRDALSEAAGGVGITA